MGMARSVDAEIAIETALPSSAGRMPQVWSAGGGLSLGGPLGASDYGAGECGGETGAGVELAGNGSPVRFELEERGDHRETSGGIRSGSSSASAGACHWHRRGEPTEGAGLSDGGLPSGAADSAVGRR